MRDRTNSKRTSRRVAGAVILTTMFSAGAATAHAKYNPPDPCGVRDDAQVFQRWGDQNHYFLMPNGGMENGLTGWVGPSYPLPGGGTFRLDNSDVVNRNETFGLRGSGGTKSLRVSTQPLASGANVSRTICVKRNEGTLRFAYRPGPAGTKLEVTVVQVARVAVGSRRPEHMATRTYTIEGTGSSAWAISPIFETGAVYHGGDSADIYVTFRATGGEWLLDGVYVDPIRIR
jgi:hypothetical protein